MESGRLKEHESLINELNKGKKLAEQLRVTSSNEEGRVAKILASYEEALLILTGSAPQGQCQSVISSSSAPSGSSISVCEVTESKDSIGGSLKRKSREDIQTVKTIEGQTDDGYSWRKYGQKGMLGSKHPRSYYRCAHRHSQGCLATKQVRRSDDDSTMFEVTYRGVHTCLAEALASKPASSEKQEQCSQAS